MFTFHDGGWGFWTDVACRLAHIPFVNYHTNKHSSANLRLLYPPPLLLPVLSLDLICPGAVGIVFTYTFICKQAGNQMTLYLKTYTRTGCFLLSTNTAYPTMYTVECKKEICIILLKYFKRQ